MSDIAALFTWVNMRFLLQGLGMTLLIGRGVATDDGRKDRRSMDVEGAPSDETGGGRRRWPRRGSDGRGSQDR